MGENSKIEWTDHTFNPWVGCTKVSPACDHCYAENWARRTGQAGLWNGERRRTTEANWRKVFKWDAAAKEAGIRRRVFCASLADVFDNQIDEEWRMDLWDLIADCTNLDWMLLTKRPQNIAKMLPTKYYMGGAWGDGWPHVWLGTTAENQTEAERRIPHLLAVPAAVRFVSMEPLLSYIRTDGWLRSKPSDPVLDWIIVGGESGPGARDMDPDWARALRDQCKAAGTAFFMKQMARKAPVPDDLMVREWPHG